MGDKRKREDTAQTARRVVDATIARSETDDDGPIHMVRFGGVLPTIVAQPSDPSSKSRGTSLRSKK
jgi:hypothetical protein